MEVEDDRNGEAVLQPIAKVNLVSEGSPAFHAGVKLDDLVLSVGSLDSTNFTGLPQIGTLVQQNAGSVISVKVRREGQTVKLALIPGPWSGRGLLGCNIIPIDNVER
jgi:26S proteasome non-ATPase regulatory subunit 9